PWNTYTPRVNNQDVTLSWRSLETRKREASTVPLGLLLTGPTFLPELLKLFPKLVGSRPPLPVNEHTFSKRRKKVLPGLTSQRLGHQAMVRPDTRTTR